MGPRLCPLHVGYEHLVGLVAVGGEHLLYFIDGSPGANPFCLFSRPHVKGVEEVTPWLALPSATWKGKGKMTKHTCG